MSGIVLSASVRQNLLSLQSTADLLSVTQNRLATGNKVNSALDNPTNFFTAQGLDNRASDINNLLDSIGNGVQVLQAANTGITSIQKLVDTAKSIANQALQTPSGYSAKSTASFAAVTGATADDILGGTSTNAKVAATGTAISTVTSASNATVTGTKDLSSGLDATGGDITFKINGTDVTLSQLGSTAGSNGDGTYSLQEIADAITGAGAGVTAEASSDGKNLILTSTGAAGVGDTITVDSAGQTALGLVGSTTGADATGGIDASGGDLKFNVNGKTVTLSQTGGEGGHYDATAVAAAINSQVGSSAKVNATLDSGKLVIASTGTAGTSDQVKVDTFTGTGFTAASLGFDAGDELDVAGTTTGGLSGTTLDIASVGGGKAVTLNFGTADGQIKSLADLNKAIAGNNLTASIDSAGVLKFSTTNDFSSVDLDQIDTLFSGTATTQTGALGSATINAPEADTNSQNSRASLIAQYNKVIDQIKTTAQDSSFNGVNLLNGDQLKLVFNETGKSTLTIDGVTFDPDGLGLSSLTAGEDFLDNANTNGILDKLNNASNTLRAQASAFGSNLSIVQIRQDFNKNLINVLQTGSSNLTLADTNEEAANSQALSTRQSIAVSALALANQSNQSVLQLLR